MVRKGKDPTKKERNPDNISVSNNGRDQDRSIAFEDQQEKERQPEKPVIEKLTAIDPNQPSNKFSYSFEKKEFEELNNLSMLQVFLKIDGTLYTKDSALYKMETYTRNNYITQSKELVGGDRELDERTMKIAVFNQFRYCFRTSQTKLPNILNCGGKTRVPDTLDEKGSIYLANIYDEYERVRERLYELEKKKIMEENDKIVWKQPVKKNQDVMYSDELRLALNKMFRQLLFNDKRSEYTDLKYFFIDHQHDTEGTNLPLLRYCYKRSDPKHSKTSQMITGIVWNPLYKDMFAVSIGSYEYEPQNIGHVYVYSLKNYKYPEYKITTHSGVMCLDFNMNEPYMLCIGCYDGSVLVYDIRDKFSKPQYRSSMKSGKHNDPVWQIRWDPEKNTKCFYTVSSDGKLCSWSLVKSKLECEVIMYLKLEEENPEDQKVCIDVIDLYNKYANINPSENYETTITRYAAATCFDFCPKLGDREFLIGTEEGTIHKCSKSYTGTYLMTYKGHNLPVYNVNWNKNHTSTFISCSADFTVKLWQLDKSTPVMNFTLDASVVDVQWSPLSSLIFSAIDSSGQIYFFNLKNNENKEVKKDNYMQSVKTQNQSGQRDLRLTRLSFNEEYQIMLVADDSGGLNVYLPNPRLLITFDDDDKKKKSNDDDKDKLDLSNKVLNIPGLKLEKMRKRKKADDAMEGTAGMNKREIEIKRMDMFLKKLEKHNKIIE